MKTADGKKLERLGNLLLDLRIKLAASLGTKEKEVSATCTP